MPLTRKGAEVLEKMRSFYGPRKGTSVFYASANKGTITGVHQGHHVPVTNSPHHPLRPPGPEGAGLEPRNYIPEGRREVMAAAEPGKGAGAFRPVAGQATVETHQARSSVGHPSLRPPGPGGTSGRGGYDFIHAGSRGVLEGTASLDKDMPAHVDAAARSQHQKLAHEVASGLRRLSFSQVARQQPQGH